MPDLVTRTFYADADIIRAAMIDLLLGDACNSAEGGNLLNADLDYLLEADALCVMIEDQAASRVAGIGHYTAVADAAILSGVWVPAAYRGLGLGGRVVDALVDAAVSEGLSRIDLAIRLTDDGLPQPAFRTYRSRDFKLLPGVHVKPITWGPRDRHLWVSADPGGVYRYRRMSRAVAQRQVGGAGND